MLCNYVTVSWTSGLVGFEDIVWKVRGLQIGVLVINILSSICRVRYLTYVSATAEIMYVVISKLDLRFNVFFNFIINIVNRS